MNTKISNKFLILFRSENCGKCSISSFKNVSETYFLYIKCRWKVLPDMFRPANSAKSFWELKCFNWKISVKRGLKTRDIAQKCFWWRVRVPRSKIDNVFQQRKSWVCHKNWYFLVEIWETFFSLTFLISQSHKNFLQNKIVSGN